MIPQSLLSLTDKTALVTGGLQGLGKPALSFLHKQVRTL